MLAQPEVVDGVAIVHAGAFAHYVGRLELAIDRAGAERPRVVSYRLVPLLAKAQTA